jgi:predicted kinase
MTHLVLIRGLPGSGKSTMAKNMEPTHHFEADMYFMDSAGNYNYDGSKIKDAHEWCFNSTKDALIQSIGTSSIVVVSNTFVKHWEMSRYIELAKELSVPITVWVAKGKYENVHSVPEEVINRMAESWQE